MAGMTTWLMCSTGKKQRKYNAIEEAVGRWQPTASVKNAFRLAETNIGSLNRNFPKKISNSSSVDSSLHTLSIFRANQGLRRQLLNTRVQHAIAVTRRVRSRWTSYLRLPASNRKTLFGSSSYATCNLRLPPVTTSRLVPKNHAPGALRSTNPSRASRTPLLLRKWGVTVTRILAASLAEMQGIMLMTDLRSLNQVRCRT